MSTLPVCFFLFCNILILVVSQTIVERDRCGPSCPADGQPSYKTYCCSNNDYNNPTASYSCCNPYIDLYIGLGIGIPIVITLITTVIVLYCCWWHHNRKKRQRLMQLYLASRVTSNGDEIQSLAPPPYTHSDNNELPRYTEEDPYASLKEEAEGEGDKELEDVLAGSTGVEPLLPGAANV